MKYSKIDIRNTVRNLIDYFKMQNEVPSQKEIVEVWSKIKEGVEKKKQRRKERYILVAITSAAAFIGCIWLGIEWYSFNNKSDISVIAAQMSNESTSSVEIILLHGLIITVCWNLTRRVTAAASDWLLWNRKRRNSVSRSTS